MKQVTELKEGEVYRIKIDEYTNYIIGRILKLNTYKPNSPTPSEGGLGNYISTNLIYRANYPICYKQDGRVCYEATPEEKQWLEACEKAGKFIPKEEAIGFPDKWYCLYSSKEEFDVLNKYCDNICFYLSTHNKYGFSSNKKWVGPETYKYYGTKITFQQFKEHILKEKCIEEEFKVGDIVKCYPEPKNINNDEKHAGAGYEPNVVFEIDRITKSSSGAKIAWRKDIPCGVYFGNFEKVKKLPKVDLTNTKIRVNTPELSKKVQEIAFSLGYKWLSCGKNIVNTEKPYLLFGTQVITCTEDEQCFKSTSHREIFLSDLGIFDDVSIWENKQVHIWKAYHDLPDNQEIILKEVVKPKVNVDLTIQKLPEIKVDINIKPKQIKQIKLETFSLNI